MTTLKELREDTGLPPEIRRWSQAKKAIRAAVKAQDGAGWPADVHRGTAMKDGRSPADFARPWKVSNVRMRHVRPDDHLPSAIAMVYRCEMPADTPRGDDRGICLQSLVFELRDADTGEVLNTDLRDHESGRVTGFLGDEKQGSKAALIWRRLTPGSALSVRLVAYPRYYFLNNRGGAILYGIGNRGHLLGPEAESPIYDLAMTDDGAIMLNGVIPASKEPEDTSPTLPADHEEHQSLGRYVRVKREALGMSQSNLGKTAGEPWFRPEGDPCDPDVWIELLEVDYLRPTDAQSANIAAALNVRREHFANLVTWTHG